VNVEASPKTLRGRGAADNPASRFAPTFSERFEDYDPSEDPSPRTQFIPDASATLINYNESPDIPFNASINVYRGCEHGCAYCYARPFHEYLGFSPGLDFETKIVVKYNAPELLRQELSSPKWQPQTIAMSGVTDCYQPAERKLKLTRRVLEGAGGVPQSRRHRDQESSRHARRGFAGGTRAVQLRRSLHFHHHP